MQQSVKSMRAYKKYKQIKNPFNSTNKWRLFPINDFFTNFIFVLEKGIFKIEINSFTIWNIL